MRRHSGSRHYTKNLKGTGSNTDKEIGFFFFNLPNPCSHTMALGSTQPLTEMSTRNLPGDKGRPARKADNLTTSVGVLMSRFLMGIHYLLQGQLCL
jgi:hypothetical protein